MSELFAEEFAEFGAISSQIDAIRGGILASFSMNWNWEEGVGIAETPGLIANRIDMVSAGLDDMTPALVAWRQIMIDEVHDRFIEEVDPYGTPWAEWAESYAAKAESTNVGKLRKTEELYEAATNLNAYPVADTMAGGDLFLDTREFPDYWAVQNYGGTVGRGAVIPARQYLGASEEGAAAMIGVFDAWVGGVIDIGMSSRGTAQIRTQGRYGQRIGLRQGNLLSRIVSGRRG